MFAMSSRSDQNIRRTSQSHRTSTDQTPGNGMSSVANSSKDMINYRTNTSTIAPDVKQDTALLEAEAYLIDGPSVWKNNATAFNIKRNESKNASLDFTEEDLGHRLGSKVSEGRVHWNPNISYTPIISSNWNAVDDYGVGGDEAGDDGLEDDGGDEGVGDDRVGVDGGVDDMFNQDNFDAIQCIFSERQRQAKTVEAMLAFAVIQFVTLIGLLVFAMTCRCGFEVTLPCESCAFKPLNR